MKLTSPKKFKKFIPMCDDSTVKLPFIVHRSSLLMLIIFASSSLYQFYHLP